MGVGKRKAEDDDYGDLGGASSSAAPELAPKAKRQKKQPKGVAGSQPEKRLAKVRNSCPKYIMERLDRVMTQRFFMVDRKREGQDLREEFKVLGSTGNVYTVVIDRLPSCNCPDFMKGNHCKHILFIHLKVLSVPISSTLYYQKALLSTELQTIFNNAPVAPNSPSHPRVQAAYAKATGRPDDAASLEFKANDSDQKKRRIPEQDDDCPICYETMHKIDVKLLTFCEECRNALHNECFQQWARTANPLTCVWCRAKWTNNAASSNSSTAHGTSEGYINLGAAAGLSPVRDTSSYYNGPRRGQPWRPYY